MQQPEIRHDRKHVSKWIGKRTDAAHLIDAFGHWLNMVQIAMAAWSNDAGDSKGRIHSARDQDSGATGVCWQVAPPISGAWSANACRRADLGDYDGEQSSAKLPPRASRRRPC